MVFSRLLLLALFVSACGHAPARPDKVYPPESVKQLWREASDRLLDRFTEDGWVVSRDANGEPEKVGDSLLWTGLAMGVMECDDATLFEDALGATIERNQGVLMRIDPLPESYKNNPISFDGETGVIFGFALRAKRCPERRERLRALWVEHMDAINRMGGKLHPNSNAKIVLQFKAAQKAVNHELGVGSKPSKVEQAAMVQEAAAWAAAVNAKHAACYRVNLAYLYISAMETLGYKSSRLGRDAFCSATKGMRLATVDHWCGRGGLKSYIDNFKYNEWEFKHQRCESWEKRDGREGLETPGLDLLMAIDEAYIRG